MNEVESDSVARPQHRRTNILLAEDDEEQRIALVGLLELAGYNVCSVATGAEMLDVVGIMDGDVAARADIIVTDVAMPGASGLFVVEELRASGWVEPVIILSGCDPVLLLARLDLLDDVELLSKPYDFDALAVLLRARAP